MLSLKIVAERMPSGLYLTRPFDGLGSCGWSPFAWTAVYGKTKNDTITNFKKVHYSKILEMKNGQIMNTAYKKIQQEKRQAMILASLSFISCWAGIVLTMFYWLTSI